MYRYDNMAKAIFKVVGLLDTEFRRGLQRYGDITSIWDRKQKSKAKFPCLLNRLAKSLVEFIEL